MRASPPRGPAKYITELSCRSPVSRVLPLFTGKKTEAGRCLLSRLSARNWQGQEVSLSPGHPCCPSHPAGKAPTYGSALERLGVHVAELHVGQGGGAGAQGPVPTPCSRGSTAAARARGSRTGTGSHGGPWGKRLGGGCDLLPSPLGPHSHPFPG